MKKQTQINKIEWREMVLKDLINCVENGNRPKGGVGGLKEGIPSIGGEHINKNGGFNFSNIKFISEEFYNAQKRGIIQLGDVLVVKDGATTGRVTFVSKDNFPYKKSLVNEHVFILRPKSFIILPKFLFYCLYGVSGQKKILDNFHGSAQGGINTQFVKNVLLPIPFSNNKPNLNEQERIVSILENAEKLKEKSKNVEELLDEYLKSIFNEMFLKDKDKISYVRLDSMCTKINDGVHFKPVYTQKGIPFISVVNVAKEKLNFDNCKFISEKDHKDYYKRCNPEKGDILYTKVGATYGIASLVDTDKEFSLYVSVCLIKPDNKKINSRFLKFLMNSDIIKKQADNKIKGIGVPDLHLIEIRSFQIPSVSLPHQEKFAKIAEQVEKMKESVKKNKLNSKELFNSLIQKAFMGEL